MKSLVTGGTGYLGGRLIEALLERGESVRVLRRRSSDVSRLSGAVELMEGDVAEATSLARVVAGCDRIFHAAAFVKTWARDSKPFDRINVEGTRNVALAARAAGVRLVYTSSFFALGPTGEEPVDETHHQTRERFFTDYERTKTEADRLIRKMTGEEGLDAVILYPGVIYGAGPLTQGNHVSQLARDFLRRKVPGIPGNGRQKWTYAHIGDVVRGHLAAADLAPAGERYLLGGPIATIEETFRLLAELSGGEPPRLHLPIGLLKGFGWVGEMAAYVTGMPPQVTRGVAETYRRHWAYSSAKAERELGYTTLDLRTGLKEVVDHLSAFAKR